MIPSFATSLTSRKLIYVLDMPSFQRDFASLKTLNHGTGPNLTFSRGTAATYFDASGVLQTAGNSDARFDHDPADGASSRGLLIEEQRTNNVQRSAEFDNAYWSKTGASITANATAAVDGNTTADRLVENNTGGSHIVARNVAGLSPQSPVTASVFVKADTRTSVRIVVWDAGAAGNNIAAVFNVSNGTMPATTNTAGNGVFIGARVTNVGNGWYRCSVSGTPNTSGTDTGVAVYLHNGTGIDYTGDGTSGLFIWGAQLEAGKFVTSYIPTTTASATRAAENVTITPVSGFINASEGTVLMEQSTTGIATETNLGVFGLGDTSVGFDNRNAINVTYAFGVSHRLNASIGVNGVSSVSSVSNASVAQSNGLVSKLGIAYKTNDFAISTNGSAVATDTSVTLPIVNSMSIGSLQGAWLNGASQLNGWVKKFAYWPKRLTDTLLQQLSTL